MTRSLVAAALRRPLVHFCMIGSLLFVAHALSKRSTTTRVAPRRDPIVVSAERVTELRAEFNRRFRRPPSEQECSAQLAQDVEEELLYREARRLSLDYQDASVRRRLIDKMRMLSQRPAERPEELVRQAKALGLDDDSVIRRLLVEKMRILLAHDPPLLKPTAAELQEYLERHRARFEQPAELTFSHVFVSERVHGKRLTHAARALAVKLRGLPPSAALRLSDPFPLDASLHAQSHARVLARFGRAFADRVFALPPGAWSAPIPSPYGLHLVRVESKSAPRLPELEVIEEQLAQAVLAERAAAQLAAGITRLRRLYEVRVAGRDDLSTHATDLAALP
jgi:hypothetical protein